MITNLDTLLSDPPLVGHNQQVFMVLLVDDQPIVAEKVRRDLLEEPRIDFHFCSDPREAVKLAKSVHPTVILLDLVMPNIDGIAAIKLFRVNPVTQDVPIIILSSKEDGALKAKAFNAGANDYLVKMPEKVELTARVVYHSTCYLSKKQRDHAYRALRESQRIMEEKNFELMQQSTIDGLTGVGNRRALDAVIERTWLSSIRSHTDISLIMIDVDHFKLFNDYYGHIAGDDCLKSIAHALTDELPRATDFIARYGGEEFVVILSATNLLGAKVVAERLCKKILRLKIANKKSPVTKFVSISAGVSSVIPDRKMSQLKLIEQADSALYKAKESGRNQVAVSQMSVGH
jgi:two-component system chemotaxis family response regulator WspR